jgi:hypothetical protein
MGCTQSAPVVTKEKEQEPPEPVPDLAAIESTPAQVVSKEPVLSDTMEKKSISLNLRQTATSGNGDTFEIGIFGSNNDDDFIIGPAFGFGGQQLRRQLQDLLVLKKNKRDDPNDTPLCWSVKAVDQGESVYKILVDKPLKEGQG